MLSSKIFVAVLFTIIGCHADIVDIRAVAEGTDAYNCHNNCGQAILESQANGDVCNDNIFLTDYANCLLCSGEDKDNIWKYYGSELTSAAAACGLSTTPYVGTTTSTIQSALVAQTAASASETAQASSNATAAVTIPGLTASQASATATADVSSSTASASASSVATAGASTTFEKSILAGTILLFGVTVLNF